MMKMLRNLSLVVLVVCIAAFASGCGGGGGGGSATTDEQPPAVVEPTPPEPTEPTDADRIAEARQEVASILTNAQARAGAASSAAAAIQTNADATPDQITDAISHSNAAQNALALIVSANTAATLATTPAEANTALANARAAQGTLNTSASAISSIQGAVQAAANQRQQREADEMAQTGGSSLIRHLRDNRKISDAVLGGLAAASLLGGETGGTTGTATYPYHKGETPTIYPIPRNTDRGVLEVTVSVGGTDVSSNSQTGKISGSGRLSNGFDLEDGGRFATVYTDIMVDARVRQKTGNTASDDAVEDTTVGATDDGIDQRYQYIADDDYLLAGIWLDDTTAGSPVLRAFAFGSQPLAATHDFCTAADVTNTSTLSRACENNATGFNMIDGFVDENESTEATYRGGVNGAYFAGGKASHFKADVSLTATFVRGSGTDVEGSKISGAITNISAGGSSVTGSIDLKEQPLANDISTAFAAGEAAGVIEGHAYTGNWRGQFFGMRATKTSDTDDITGNDPVRTTTTTYSPDKPNSVAGAFFVERQTVGEGNAAFIGAFGAHR